MPKVVSSASARAGQVPGRGMVLVLVLAGPGLLAQVPDRDRAHAAAVKKDYALALRILRPHLVQGEQWAVLDEAHYLTWAGRMPEAREAYRHLAVLDPGSLEARTGLIRMAMAMGEPRAARRELDRLPPALARTPEARLLDGQLAAREGRSRAAAERLEPLARAEGPQRDPARGALRGLAETHGPRADLGNAHTVSSDPQDTSVTSLKASLPWADGALTVDAVRHQTRNGGGQEAPVEGLAGLACPLGPFRLAAKAGRVGSLGGSTAGIQSLTAALILEHGLEVRAGTARNVILASPQAVRNRVGVQSVFAGFSVSAPADSFTTGFDRLSLSAGTHGLTWNGSYEHRWNPGPLSFGAGLTARGVQYSRSLPLGFWNPESQQFRGFTGAAGYEQGGFTLKSSGQAGWQRENGSRWNAGWSLGLELQWNPGGGPVSWLAGWTVSRTDLDTETSTDPDQYRESTVRFGLRVVGPWRW